MPNISANVPGRKTDVKDAEWIAQLLRHGLLRGSFIPPLPQRDLRDLTRQRTNLVRERASVVNRLQLVLEWANLKLSSVVTNMSGISARSMLKAMIAGETDAEVLATLAKGSLRRKQQELAQALQGQVRDHHRFLLTQHLTHLDFLEAQIAVFDCRIREVIEAQTQAENDSHSPISSSHPGCDIDLVSPNQPLSWHKAVALLDTIPGIARSSNGRTPDGRNWF